MEGGKVVFKFLGDDKDLNEKTNSIGSTFGKVGATIGKSILTGTAVATGAIAGLFGKSVQMAGDLEQQLGGTESVFGEFANQVQEMSKTAFKTAGLSANDYMATINKMGALMQGSGLDIKTSMDLSSQAMQRASDVASIMGIDINSAMESIAGAAKGNFTMMDNLGVAMNATTIEAYAMSKGINKTYNEMSKAEQVSMAMQMFLEKTTYAMGNYEKENETFAGSLQTLKSSFDNFMSGAGSVEDVITSLTSFTKILVDSIIQMAPQITSGIVQLINGIVPQIPSLLEQLLPTLIDGAVSLINGIVQSLPTIIPILMNGIVQAIGSIVNVLPQILDALLKATIMIITALAEQMPVLIPQIIDAILAMIPVLIDNLPLFIKAGMQLIVGIVEGLIKSAPKIITQLKNMVVSWLGYLKQVPGMFLDIGKDLITGLWNGIKNNLDWVINKIKGMGSSIIKAVKGIFGIHSPSREFAYIGEMNMTGLAEGMEDMKGEVDATFKDMMNFDNAFNLSPNLASNSALNMSPIVNVVVNNNMEQDPLGQMVNNIKTFSGGSKNDYNYGMGGA